MTAPASIEPLIDVKRTRELLGIGRTTLFRMIQQGDIGTVRVGDRVLFEPDEIRRYIAEHRVVAATSAPAPLEMVDVIEGREARIPIEELGHIPGVLRLHVADIVVDVFGETRDGYPLTGRGLELLEVGGRVGFELGVAAARHRAGRP